MDKTQLDFTGDEGVHGQVGQGGSGGQGGWGPDGGSSLGSSSGEIKTNFTLGSSFTNFYGVQKSL